MVSILFSLKLTKKVRYKCLKGSKRWTYSVKIII